MALCYELLKIINSVDMNGKEYGDITHVCLILSVCTNPDSHTHSAIVCSHSPHLQHHQVFYNYNMVTKKEHFTCFKH